MTPLEIRLLALRDAGAFLALRGEALAAAPPAFRASPQTDVALAPDFVRARLAEPGETALFGAFAAGELAAIAFARALPGVRQVHLGVSESAQDALRLDRRVGLRAWGTEPAALEHGERVVGEHHLALPLA